MQQPQIYDAFMFNSELDMLEVRLLELYDFVDYFVICEAPVPLATQTYRSSCSHVVSVIAYIVHPIRSQVRLLPCAMLQSLAWGPYPADETYHAHA